MNNEKEEATKKDQEVNKEKEEETKRKESFYTKKSEIKSAFYSNKPMFVLLYKETLLNINDLDSSFLSVISSLLQEFEDVFLGDGPSSLPLEETKEIQCQVEELISSCVLHVLLVPKKDGSWRMCIYFCAINNIMVNIRGQIFLRKGGVMRMKEQMTRFKFQLGYYKSKGQEISRGTKWAHEGVHLGQPNITRRVRAKSSLWRNLANKEVQKIINIIKAIDGDHSHEFGN